MTQQDAEEKQVALGRADKNIPENQQDAHDGNTAPPKLSRRAQEALKKANPLTEGILAKVLGDQVSRAAI